MNHEYEGVITRFLRDEERLILSEEKEMPLVIEAKETKEPEFLQTFLSKHSEKIIKDIAHYGAVLLRGFDIRTEKDFEDTILSIQGMQGVSEAFMSEEGRVHVGSSRYVLHTNAVYKTGGTLYLGGFHSENYYSADVPAFISFCCFTPSIRGGETGLVNMAKIYHHFSEDLKEKLEKQTFFVAKWMVSEIAERYNVPREVVERICVYFKLPIVGQGKNRFVLMYKPNVFMHPLTQEASLQINLFEIPTLNAVLRQCFMKDYAGPHWFWHRFIWKLPHGVLKIIERIYIILASFSYSPKASLGILFKKIRALLAFHQPGNIPPIENERVGSCFREPEVKELAQLIRNYYCSCLWQQGDILLVDNRKVMHAGMPGAGPRVVRAMICNPIDMSYDSADSGLLHCKKRTTESVGYYLATGKFDKEKLSNANS